MRCIRLSRKIYTNRDLSWLEFNKRILEEANDVENPIMECAKFLGITSSNLDEFFMTRVSRMINNVEKKIKKKDSFGLKLKKVFKKLRKNIHNFYKKQYKCYRGYLIPKFKKEGIRLLEIDELDDTQKIYLKQYFKDTIYPVLTPLAIDSTRPFPFLVGRNLNVAVEMKDSKNTELVYIILFLI